jgi:hypothetical protein
MSRQNTISVSEKNFIALIFGTHLNANSIIRGLVTVGIDPKNICLINESGKPWFSARLLNPFIKTREFDFDDAAKLPQKLRELFGIEIIKVLFFTDERFLTELSTARRHGKTQDIRFFPGSDRYMETILDRLKFYRFIEKNQLAPVPKTIPGDKNPFELLDGRVLVRPNVSWRSSCTRQSVAIVASKAELEKIIDLYRKDGLRPEDWCYQEVLSTKAKHNISVCGWYDAKEQHLFCTRKLLQHPESCGNGDVIELMLTAPGSIIEQSYALLQALEYKGPLELEWVFDENNGIYKIIELNPRFWMQHSLAGAASRQAVIRRYMGVNCDFHFLKNINPNQVRYWVNPLYALFRLLKGDLLGIRFYFMKGAVSPISLTQALVYAPIHFLGKCSLE